jgi:hypothetical protein
MLLGWEAFSEMGQGKKNKRGTRSESERRGMVEMWWFVVVVEVEVVDWGGGWEG